MGKRMRMTLPKKEEDLQKVVEEVEEIHGHEHHHHHHEVEGLDEILHTIDVLMDTMNTRLSDLEEKVDKLREEVVNLYKLFGLLAEAIMIDNVEQRKQVIAKAVEILKTGIM
jgi:hypothetical protein